jgi:hypothetical protein
MKFYLELTSELLDELIELYTFISCAVVYNGEDIMVVECETDYLTCAKIDQHYHNKLNIYHACDRYPDMTNVLLDKTSDCVIISKDNIVAKATVNDGDVDLAEEKAMLLFQSILEMNKVLQNEFQE